MAHYRGQTTRLPQETTHRDGGGRTGRPGDRVSSVLDLQRLAGNAAAAELLAGGGAAAARVGRTSPVTAVTLQRQDGGKSGKAKTATAAPGEVVRTPEQVKQLVADILTVIQQMEVGKGGSATESNYHTSSGVRASYASRMQATIPWSVTLLKGHADLREKFKITMEELRSAEKCMAAVTAVWQAVMKLAAGTTLEQAKADATVAAKLPDTGLDDADLGRMLKFGAWRGEVKTGLRTRTEKIEALGKLTADELAAQATAAELKAALKPADKRALAQWRKDKKKGRPPAATAADLTDKERAALEKVVGTRQVVDPLVKAGVDAGLDIDETSARGYTNREMKEQDKKGSAHWGEDQAAWRRYAVEKKHPEIGEKIKSASVDDEGMTLGRADAADAVAGYMKNKTWDDDKVAWAAFKRQNGAADYADEALKIFKKTHITPTPTPTTPPAAEPAPK